LTAKKTALYYKSLELNLKNNKGGEIGFYNILLQSSLRELNPKKIQRKEVENRKMKMLHRGEKGFTLIELLIVVAILGIIAAVIIPNIGAFMTTGTLAAANSEAENVKTASLAFFAEAGVWPTSTADAGFGNYTAGTLKASYGFDTSGFINSVGDPGGTGGGTTSIGYSGIHWENPVTAGHGKWVRD
jgi:prepilin-type N-terminal cleavage/methylation domain-containing protein